MTISVKVVSGVVTDRVVGTVNGWLENDVAQIDWSYDGKTFSPPPWDPSNSPSVWHNWVGDKETRIGAWVEDTEAKALAEKAAAYEADASRSTLWDKVDSLSKDEFKTYLQDNITDLGTAKSVLIAACLEIARLRRKAG